MYERESKNMSRKTDLLQSIKRFKEAYETLESTLAEKKKSGLYTQVGYEEEKKKLLTQVSKTVQQMHDEQIRIVDNGVENLENKWKHDTVGRLNDVGYQSGLTNVLKMLEIGAITEKKDIENIVEAYQGDYGALAAVKTVLSNSVKEETRNFALLIPKDAREESRRLLGQLRKNIDHTVTIYSIENALCGQIEGFSGLSLSLDGLLVFVNDRLTDDLEVCAWQ